MDTTSIYSNLTGNGLYNYIREVNKIPLLTDEEEVRYAKLKDEGDLNAAKMLVSSHLRLVVKIAHKYVNYGLSMMDLISEGNIGLMRAVKTFDHSTGYRLSTYAMWWIKACIQDYVLKMWSIVKIGTTVSQKKLFFNLRKIKNKILSVAGGRKELNNSDVEYISKTLNVRPQDVIDMDSRLTRHDTSLNRKPVGSDSDLEVMDLLPAKTPKQDVIVDARRSKAKNHKILVEAMGNLSERERDIINMRYLADKTLTLADLSAKYNISGERVRQIEVKALEKIKKYFKTDRD